MKMCNWCNPLIDKRGSCPYNKFSNNYDKSIYYYHLHTFMSKQYLKYITKIEKKMVNYLPAAFKGGSISS